MKLLEKLSQKSLLFLLPAFALLCSVSNLLFAYAIRIFGTKLETNEVVEGLSGNKLVLMVLLIAPLVETIIYVLVLGEICLFVFKKTKFNEILTIFISAALFSWSHNFGWLYVVNTFILGGIFMISYLTIKKSNRVTVAFLSTVLIHALTNSVAFLHNEIL